MKVVVLYEFSAQPNSGEISIVPNEILTVTRQDVGDGWWEGQNSRGEKGLFPADYVAQVNDNVNNNNANNNHHSGPDPWSGEGQKPASLVSFSPASQGVAPNIAPQPTQQPLDQQYDGDWGDDDWDDSDSQASENPASEASPYIPPQSQIAPIHVGRGGGGDNGSIGGGSGNGNFPSRPAPVVMKKSINRFSHFVKSGGEDYILGLKTYNVNQNDFIHIIDEGGVFKWSPSYFIYTVAIDNPKKESKMKGLKSFIAYQLTPSDSGVPVSRRYKHFDWLHERLQDKFTTIPIPSLPDKQISGRYQEDFIEGRKIQLQSWVNRICRHPVLSQSTVWKHFITCKDEKSWKNGKRRAEKDELVGGLFFLTISIPENVAFNGDTEQKLDRFARFISKMDESTKNIYNVSQEMPKRYQQFYKREYCKVASIFSNLSEAFASSPTKSTTHQSLINSINFTSTIYETIGKHFDEQSWLDFSPMANLMHEYRGVLTAWPEINQIYRGAIQKKKEHKKAYDENRMDRAAFDGICRRADVVTYATLAEMNHFEEERIVDYNNIMRTFLTGQLSLYKKIVSNLEEALAQFPE